MKTNDIVKFNSNAKSAAALFCHQKSISGLIVGIDNISQRYIVNVGFKYLIYERAECIDLIVGANEIPDEID